MGKGNASAIATLVERTSRYVLLQRLPYDHSAERMAYALSVATSRLPALLKQSRTWDQGREMARHAAFTTMTGIPVFFGDPHSPWPRGTNDNTNGLLREYFPQGTDFSVYDQNYLDGAVALVGRAVGQAGPVQPRQARRPLPRSEFAGFRYPPEIIAVAVRWYLRYSLSYRDVEELLAERGIDVDHVTIYRWVQRFTLLFIDAARPCRHAAGDRWFVDETYVKVAGRFFRLALGRAARPVEVSTDRAPAYPRVLDELLPAAQHVVERYANNPIEADHGRFKARLRPMRGLKRLRSTAVIAAGHAFVQNVRRGHYELAIDIEPKGRVSATFTELALAI